MSKAKLKKALQRMEKEEIIEFVLVMHGKRKEITEYLNYCVAPNEREKLRKYKGIIEKEFSLRKNLASSNMRFPVAKKAIDDFISLSPSIQGQADIMLFFIEQTCAFSYTYGDMWSRFYEIVEEYFDETLQFMKTHQLLDFFKERLIRSVEWTLVCGYGFSDEMVATFKQHFPDIQFDVTPKPKGCDADLLIQKFEEEWEAR